MSHSFQLTPPVANTITSATFEDNKGQVDYPDTRVKLTDIKLHTCEILPSAEYKKSILDLQSSKGYLAYPVYSIQNQVLDVRTVNGSL